MPVKIKRKLNAVNVQRQRVNILTKKGKIQGKTWIGPKQDWNSGRQMLNTIVPCPLPGANSGEMRIPKGLGGSAPMHWSGCSTHCFSLGLAWLTLWLSSDVPCSWLFQQPGYPLHFWLHSNSFKQCLLRSTFPGHPGLFLKSWVEFFLTPQFLHSACT